MWEHFRNVFMVNEQCFYARVWLTLTNINTFQEFHLRNVLHLLEGNILSSYTRGVLRSAFDIGIEMSKVLLTLVYKRKQASPSSSHSGF